MADSFVLHIAAPRVVPRASHRPSMRFTLVDRITHLEPGKSVTAVKNVSLAEEYLQDHFPKFPVLPGVLMLEACTQASAWLIRVSDDFAHSMVVLKEARNVKYANFLEPGQRLTVHATMLSNDEREARFRVEGQSDDENNVTARLVLEKYNLVDRGPIESSDERAETDEYVKSRLRETFALLFPS